MPSELPPEIEEACLALGLEPRELSIESVNRAWQERTKKVRLNFLPISLEDATRLEEAKDTLITWLQSYSGDGL